MVKLSQNFDFAPKIAQIYLKGTKTRPSNFQEFLFLMSYVNDKNLKEFKIFDLTPIGWPTMEWPIYQEKK